MLDMTNRNAWMFNDHDAETASKMLVEYSINKKVDNLMWVVTVPETESVYRVIVSKLNHMAYEYEKQISES